MHISNAAERAVVPHGHILFLKKSPRTRDREWGTGCSVKTTVKIHRTSRTAFFTARPLDFRGEGGCTSWVHKSICSNPAPHINAMYKFKKINE